jgi:Holliday junction resolvase
LSKHSYSPSQFGRDAEYIIALYLISKGWQVKLSKGSRGPADLMAKKDLILLYIQIKASSKLPRIKGSNITKLKTKSQLEGALPVVATLQPFFQFSNQNKKTIAIMTNTKTTTKIITTHGYNAKKLTNNSIDTEEEEEKEQQTKRKIEFKIYFYNLHDWSKLDL